MDGQSRDLRAWLAERWERLVAVNVPDGDEEKARLGRLFNTLMGDQHVDRDVPRSGLHTAGLA